MEITAPQQLDQFASINVVTELCPAAGQSAPIRPPTFANSEAKSWLEKIALTPAMTVPTRESGWSDVRRDAAGSPEYKPAVLINSVGAEAHLFSQLLIDTDIAWGRIVIDPLDPATAEQVVDTLVENYPPKQAKDNKPDWYLFRETPDIDTTRALIIDHLTSTGSDSWTASHRTGDADIRFATDPRTGKQVWQGGDLKRQLISANPCRDVDWIWRNAANSLLFGFWMSHAGVGIRHKWARALSSEIFGYGAVPVHTGVQKGTALGDFDKELPLRVDESSRALIVDTAAASTRRPSELGMGQVPGPLDASAVSCEVILRRAGISLTHLRRIRHHGGPAISTAIVRAATAAGLYALATASAEGAFLRSGTDLAVVGSMWTARSRSGSAVDLVVDPAVARAVLDQALADLDALGVPQAPPIRLVMSDVQAEGIARAVASANSGDTAAKS